MKKLRILDECTAQLGDLVTLTESYTGDELVIGERYRVVDFFLDEETAEFISAFALDGEIFEGSERIRRRLYVVEREDGKRCLVWPEETEQCKGVVFLRRHGHLLAVE